MTESELATVMTSGWRASRAASWPHILFGIEAQHLLTAVIMTAPGTLMMAKVFPETEVLETMGLSSCGSNARTST